MNYIINEYHNLLCNNFPTEIEKYYCVPEIKRLKYIGYLCGMDYCSDDIYNMRMYYSTFDHSVSTARIVYNFTHDYVQTLAALFHDISTPTFRHVIDFYNGDTLTQESTEEHTERIIKSSKLLSFYLKEDGIHSDDVIDYKKYPIADNERPKLSADRLEGVFMNNYVWCKSIEMDEIKTIYNNIKVLNNEDGISEIGFKNKEVALKLFKQGLIQDKALQSNEDIFSMHLLSFVVKNLIDNNLVTINDLYSLTEMDVINIIRNSDNVKVKELWETFTTMNKIERSDSSIPDDVFYIDNDTFKVKRRYINPLIEDSGRLLSLDDNANALINEMDSFRDSRFAYVKLKKIKSR